MPGTSIAVKGTTFGTVSNAEGKFSLRVPAGKSVITVSSIGYSAMDINVENQSTLEVKLIPDNKILSEVVVPMVGVEYLRQMLMTSIKRPMDQ